MDGVMTRTFFKIGERMFGQVPTPERLMAQRMPLMLGLGGLYGAIEWFGTIDPQLRALLNVQGACRTRRSLYPASQCGRAPCP